MITTFNVEAVGNRWMAIGRTPAHGTIGDGEVWSDGCCVTDKMLAQAICRNMRLAYEQGLKDAAVAINETVNESTKIRYT